VLRPVLHAATQARTAARALAVVLAALLGAAASAGEPPRTALDVVEAARSQGAVIVYSTTDPAAARPLLDGFAALFPEITVEYHHLYSTELYERFRAEAREGASADVLWSSAMDLQLKLANDGHALAYQSAELDQLPAWATWRGEAYATTYEPIVFAYDRRALAPEEVPRTHRALAQLLLANRGRLRGKVGSYDPERSGIGCLLLTQDARLDPGYDETLRAYGEVRLRGYHSTIPMLDAVASGELSIAVDVIASYARERQRREPNLGIAYPTDFALVLSRVALIPRSAPHPDAARLFLDYLLSGRGQELAAASGLGSVRLDLAGPGSAVEIAREHATVLRPIPVRPSVLVYVDGANRQAFLKRWRRAAAAKRADGVPAPR
jgi:iron(III) transport system substrate-binding protein